MAAESPADPTGLPDVAAVLGEALRRVPEAERPLLIALAERLAAERYRGWADQAGEPERAAQLRACADREEEIARRVEDLHPGARSIQQQILERHPDLLEVNRSLFAGRPLGQQLTLQARGERLGAATWRALAGRAGSEAARQVYLGCALLEEASASYLESLAGS